MEFLRGRDNGPLPTLCLAIALTGFLIASEAVVADEQEAWGRLADARASLTRGTLVAAFAQSFVPAGFSSGERETGRVRLALPDCLRWDYEVPYPKSFLICEETVWTWNDGESSGRRHRIEAGEDETGLDLLRLSVERLRDRYTAETSTTGEGLPQVVLVPLEPTARITRAALTLEAGTDRPVVIEYIDLEGNTTRFEISGYRPSPDSADLEPPHDIEWLED